MNKRMNVILNTIEFIAVILISSIMYACYKLSYTEFNNYLIINKTIVTLIVIMEIIIVGIELLLFIFYNKNQKYIYIGYTIIEFVLTALINIYIPFSGLIVLVLFSLIKNVCRQRMITTIYNKNYLLLMLLAQSGEYRPGKPRPRVTMSRCSCWQSRHDRGGRYLHFSRRCCHER